MKASGASTPRNILPVRKKRRSRPSLASRLRTFWIALLVFAALGAWGAVSLVRWTGFDPGAPTILGLTRVAPDDVARAAAIDHRGNIWLADVRAMERRIEAIPYVATARVRRRLPAAVTIDVEERVADGCVGFAGRGADDDVTVDATDRVLERGCENAPHVQYTIHGSPLTPGRTLKSGDLLTLQDDGRRLSAMGRTFASYSLDRFGGLDARLPDGIAVRFGDDEDLDRKEHLIGPVLAAVKDRIGAVAALDVRAPSAPIVDFR